MRIKNYSGFLRMLRESAEEIGLDIWDCDSDSFATYMNDLTDLGWEFEVKKRFFSECDYNAGTYNKPRTIQVGRALDFPICFARDGKIVLTPCYQLELTVRGDDPEEGFFSGFLPFLKGVAGDELDLEMYVYDGDYRERDDADLGSLTLDKIGYGEGKYGITGFTYGDGSIDEDLILIFVGKDREVTAEEYCSYMKWDLDPEKVKIDGSAIWVRKDQDDLVKAVEYRGDVDLDDILIPGDFDYHRWESDYSDVESVIRYNLTDEALKAAVRKMISDYGFEELVSMSGEAGLDLEGMDQEQAIDALVGERFQSALTALSKDYDPMEDVARDYESWYAMSRADKFYDEVQENFDDALSDVLTFQKDEHMSEWQGGDKKWYHMYRYWVRITGEMMFDLWRYSDWEYSDFTNYGPDFITDWLDTQNPVRMSAVGESYGDVDKEEFSKEMMATHLAIEQ